MKHAALVLLLSTLLITACGSRRVRPVSSDPLVLPPDDPNVKVQLVLFGAPPCENCSHDFPKVRDALAGIPADLRHKLTVRLFVETGSGWLDAPTAAIAEKYRANDGLPFPVYIDGVDKKGRPSYEYMLNLTSDILPDPELPTAAIVDKKGNFFDPVHKEADIFAPGTSFNPDVITKRILEHLTESK